MLDDLQLINQRDPSDALGIAERQCDQLSYQFDFSSSQFEPSNIVYSGIGGSSVAGRISKAWLDYSLPFEIISNYDIPGYVSNTTLFIACSYSGDTEETLSAIEQAAAKDAKICVIATGGKMVEIAKQRDYPYIVLPAAEQPRFGVLYHLNALVALLGAFGLIDQQLRKSELTSSIQLLKESVSEWQSVIPSDKNLAKQIAIESAGKSVVIYTGPKLVPAAYKWKIDYNENAKQLAWWNEYPELNHNEFIGWTEQPPIKPYSVIDLRSDLEAEQINKRFKITAKLLSGRRPEPITVNAKGANLIEQLLYLVMLGDFTTIYSSILAGVNPIPVDLVSKFKKELES
ncbi:MAG TPA: bifunctional phosphoglucose/phosphomannose isomerase [Candidatus Saccharimonadales bacterium]